MSDIKHTPEPWRVELKNVPIADTGDYDGVVQIFAGDAKQPIIEIWDESDEAEENARRIVACVNSCAGIPTDLLEVIQDFEKAGVQTINSVMLQRDAAWEEIRAIRNAIKADPQEATSDEVERVVAQRAKLEKQRDELLAVLKITRSNIASLGPAGAIEPYMPYREWLSQVDAAIASVNTDHIVEPTEMVETSAPAIVFYPAGSLGEEVQP